MADGSPEEAASEQAAPSAETLASETSSADEGPAELQQIRSLRLSIAELERKLAETERALAEERDHAADYMRRWQSAQADFSNYKRRAQQEQEQRDRLLAAQALAPAIVALDSLERAFLALPTSLRSFSWIEGIALVELQLRRALELQGIRQIEVSAGQPFDPARHEPIGEVESDQHPAGAVAVVVQPGYEAYGRLIRPALVQLARAPQTTQTDRSAQPAQTDEQDQPSKGANETDESNETKGASETTG